MLGSIKAAASRMAIPSSLRSMWRTSPITPAHVAYRLSSTASGAIEAERRTSPRIAVGKLATLAVVLELEQLVVALLDPAIEVPVLLETREAEVEREARIGGDDLEIAIDRVELREELRPRRAPALVVEELEVLPLVDQHPDLLHERGRRRAIRGERADRRGLPVARIEREGRRRMTLGLGEL